MLSINFMLFFIPVLSLILIGVNFLLAPHTPYKEKKTPFECGYHSFIDQTRVQFNIMFSIYAYAFLLLDLEIIVTYPSSVSLYNIEIYGLILTGIFVLMVTLGFGYEIGKGALVIESKQSNTDSHLYSKKSLLPLMTFLKFLLGFSFNKIISNISIKIISTLYIKVASYIANKFVIPILQKYIGYMAPKIKYRKIDLKHLGVYYI